MLRLPYKVLLAAPLLLLLYLYGLTRVGLIGPDEPRYAAIGREMALSGDWVTPRLWGVPWFEKPALLYWLVGLGNKLQLDADLAPRAPVAILSVLFLLFYFLQIRREFGERAAWFASAILATSAGWLAFSHLAVTDLPMAAAFSASVLLALPWVRSGGRRGLAIAGALLGAAVLAKGLVPVVLLAPIVWVGRRRWPDLLLLAIACLAVTLPWYAACWLNNGDVFVEDFFWKHHFGRFLSTDLQHVQPVWFYVPVLLGLIFPWTPLLPVLRRTDWREPRQQLLLLTVLFGFVFFSASTNKLPGYLLPLIPLLVALVGIRLAAAPPNRWLIPACAALLCATPVIAETLPEALVAGLSRTPIAGFSGTVFAGIVVCTALVALLQMRGRTALAFAATVAMTAICITYLKYDMYPRLDHTASARFLWRDLSRTQPVQCIEAVSRGIRYGLNYYAGRDLPNCSGERERPNEANSTNHDILDGR